MTVCARCRRVLHRDPVMVSGSGYGPKCAQAVTGVKPIRRRARSTGPDERQVELFTEARP